MVDRNKVAENYARWRKLTLSQQDELRSKFGMTSCGEENLPLPREFEKLSETDLPLLEEVKDVTIKAEVKIIPKKVKKPRKGRKSK